MKNERLAMLFPRKTRRRSGSPRKLFVPPMQLETLRQGTSPQIRLFSNREPILSTLQA
jgi:hypothetical protein